MTISELIKKIASETSQFCSLICTVDAVDKVARTIDVTPIDDSAQLLGVNLQANQDSEHGIIVFPAVGSYVAVTRFDNYHAAMFLADEVEAIEVKVGETIINIDGSGVVFNDGTHGAVKVDKMVEWMQKVYADLTTLQTQLSTHPVAGNGAPLALIFNPTTPTPDPLTFEDKKLKH